jgi:hypothetical protein
MPDSQDKDDRWIKKTIPLSSGHKWKCKTGNQLFVADRGAVAFEFPAGWVIRHNQIDTVFLHNVAPPDDEARIALTIFHLPPVAGGWGQLPLDQMLLASQKAGQPAAQVIVQNLSRADLELAWAEKPPYPDPENGKPIRCRHILARARGIQALITFDVYVESSENFENAWRDLLETLRLGIPRDITGETGN